MRPAGRSFKRLLALTAFVAAIAAADSALACAVCYGDPNSAQTKAMGAGILVLLGCIGTVLASFASAFCYWMYRSHKLALTNEGATH